MEAPHDWNEAEYLLVRPDIIKAIKNGTFKSGWHHYLLNRKTDSRPVNYKGLTRGSTPYHWNEPRYLLDNPDVVKAIQAGIIKSGWQHYLASGKREKRPPTHFSFEKLVKDGILSINYVLATWSGERRAGNDEYHRDKLLYLKKHIKSLQVFKHHLAQITIVVPKNKNEPEEYSKFLKNIPRKIQNARVVVTRRENEGQSYGSYAHTYQLYRDKFTHYILIEDDYCFFKDYFDVDLISNFEITDNCGFLCSLVAKNGHEIHAAISNGITSAKVLKKIWDKYDGIPYGKDSTKKVAYSAHPQITFSQNFLDVGTRLVDLIETYRAPFNHAGELRFYGNTKEDLIIPLQFLEVFDQEGLLLDI